MLVIDVNSGDTTWRYWAFNPCNIIRYIPVDCLIGLFCRMIYIYRLFALSCSCKTTSNGVKTTRGIYSWVLQHSLPTFHSIFLFGNTKENSVLMSFVKEGSSLRRIICSLIADQSDKIFAAHYTVHIISRCPDSKTCAILRSCVDRLPDESKGKVPRHSSIIKLMVQISYVSRDKNR